MKNVLQVEGLCKSYRIGLEEKKSDTLAGAFFESLKSPITNFRNLRNLRDSVRDEGTLFWALKDVNFDVKEGEVLGIIGHNGAGKSTLLKILSRITEPTSGRVTIHGRVSSLLEVGTGFHPDLTGRENIYMNGTILGMRKKEIDAKLDEIIAFSGISHHIDTPVKRYSSGMTVRLAFSVAAHLEPEVLIIDEVLAVGDIDFQKKCLNKMESVASSGRVIVFVSHNMHAIKELCHQGIVLNKGRILDRGNVNDVVARYLSNSKFDRIVIQDLGTLEMIQCSLNNVKPELDSGDPIELRMTLRNKTSSDQIVNIDFAISDMEDNYAIHSRSPWAGKPMKLKANSTSEVLYQIKESFLGPGSYNFITYIYDSAVVHLFIKNLCPFTVSAKNISQASRYMDGSKSSYIPPFEIRAIEL